MRVPQRVFVALTLLSACADVPPPSAAPSRPPPSPAAAAPPAAETPFEKVLADTPRQTARGGTLTVPKGWFVRPRKDGFAFEEPDRELGLTLFEVDAETAPIAVAKAWASVARPAPAKIRHAQSHPDIAGWDEIAETAYETPTTEARVLAMNVRRKGNRAWVFLVEGKVAALQRRGAHVREIIGGLKVPGVEDEDLASKPVLPLDGERAKAFESFVEEARRKTQVPGAAVAVVHDGRIVFEKGFGVREHGKKEAVTPRTRFMIGSVTKSISSLLIAKLVDEGKLAWTTKVKDLLPGFETGDAAFTDQLTIAHTFCACTGMPRQDLDFVFEYAKVAPDGVLKAFAKVKPTTGFGETFQYSNQMTALGGFLAARVAHPKKALGAAYEAALKEKLFGPMGMADTTASFEEGRRGNAASPHGGSLVGAFGEPVVLPSSMETFVTPLAPAGAVFSTAHDMARYALVELASGKTPEGKQVVSAENLLERRKPRVKASARASYGLGLARAVDKGVEVVSHDGGTFGFVARFVIAPQKGFGAVILTNSSDSGELLTSAVGRRLIEVMLGAKEKAAKELDADLAEARDERKKALAKLSPMPEELATRLVGSWHADRLGPIRVTRDSKDPKLLRIDAGEWSTRAGYRKLDDGAEQLILLDSPLNGMSLRVDGAELVLTYAQDTFRFARR
jgi:CubicO group peptidase (beta-lactamase class C family)